MTATNDLTRDGRALPAGQFWGLFWLLLAVLGAGLMFQTGIAELLKAWQSPEYSHGPLIPVLSAVLFLRQLKGHPIATGPVVDVWPGLAVIVAALTLGAVGRLIQIPDFVAYALILWVGGILLACFGWREGRHFWPPVLHLIYMLPLPGVLYYGLSTWLQGVSSELGVWFLQQLRIPVYLEGNIIDLGVYRLHVAEACSGLRYLFPILSFSYIFAVLYRGPIWHKAVLLISAAPITVVMNSVRIAIAGWIVDNYGIDHVEGFSHFFEGWVIFLACVLILFCLAWLMLRLHPQRPGLAEALDLDLSGLSAQAVRLRLVQPTRALILGALLVTGLGLLWQSVPQRQLYNVDRLPFSYFPGEVGDWTAGLPQRLEPEVEKVLAADDYLAVNLTSPAAPARVELFMAWYRDQMTGGTHSPTVCLPSAGWEIASLETIDAPADAAGAPFTLKRAVIQQGTERMLVYYWFDQQGLRTASSFRAKLAMTVAKVRSGRADGALVRLITPIRRGETDAVAEARLRAALGAVVEPLPRFLPGR